VAAAAEVEAACWCCRAAALRPLRLGWLPGPALSLRDDSIL